MPVVKITASFAAMNCQQHLHDDPCGAILLAHKLLMNSKAWHLIAAIAR
jgi:hypothetical protein